MNLEEVAGHHASQIEFDASRSAQSRLSDGLKSQLASVLEDCIQSHHTPPRVDVVAAIERLQTIGPALAHPQSDEVVVALIHQLNQCDPTTIQNRSDLIRLIQGVMPRPIHVGPTQPQCANTSTSFHRHRTRAQAQSEPTGLSQAIKRFIKFIFG